MNETIQARQHLRSFLARPRDARLALFAGESLLQAGALEAAVAVWSLGEESEPRLRALKDVANLPPPLRTAAAHADEAFRTHFSRLHRDAMDAFVAPSGADISRVRNAIWPLTHDAPVEYRTPLHEPAIFYMPDLPAEPVTSNERLPWVDGLERAWRDVRSEFERAMSDGIALAPYVPGATADARWSQLRGTLTWSSIHLFKDAQPTDHAARFPATIAALKDTDLVSIDGEPMEVFFSRLTPGAHIPPHFGLTNTRLTTHLPLIVPDGCGIRVGTDTYHWHEGEIIAFDDSFEHEAWNRGASDRVVLIFEAHHPDLSGDERVAIEHAYSVRQNWHKNRLALLDAWLKDNQPHA